MKRVLITGGSGFIGRHTLQPLIELGYDVHCTTYSSAVQDAPHIHWHQVDLLNNQQTASIFEEVRPTHLLYLAWITDPAIYWESLANQAWLEAGINAFEHFAQNGGRRAVFSGSCAEYEWGNYVYSENKTPTKPSTLYGKCKRSLSLAIKELSDKKSVDYAWGRVFQLYGPYESEKRLIPYLVSCLLQQETACCSSPGLIRDYLYVKDVAGAFATLLNSEITGEINIASGIPVSIKDIACKIATKLNSMHLLEYVVRETNSTNPQYIVGDSTRLSNELEWNPTYSLDSGLDEYIAWRKETLKHKIHT